MRQVLKIDQRNKDLWVCIYQLRWYQQCSATVKFPRRKHHFMVIFFSRQTTKTNKNIECLFVSAFPTQKILFVTINIIYAFGDV